MASIIRIKRSSSSSAPTTLGNGELAYSAGSGTQANGGERLYIGFGTEVAGSAPQFIIGGKYFTDLLDHTHGTLTANSALIADSDKKLDNLKVDNLDLNGNTLSSTDLNGNIVLSPNGTGYVTVSGTNALVIPSGTTAQQGPGVAGSIRFNTTTSQYEGYNGSNWTSMGGVRSVDGLTYITAESSPGASDDIIHFYAATGVSTSVEVAQLNSTKFNLLQTTNSIDTTTGALTVAGGVGIGGNLYVGGNNIITGNSSVTGTLGVTGNTTLSGTLGVTGNTTLSGTLTVTGGITLSSTANVVGDFSVNTNKFTVQASSGNTTVAGTLGVTGATNLNSTLAVTSDLSVNTNKFTVQASSGNTTVAGTLGVTGATTLSSTANVVGDFSVNTNKFTVQASSGNTTVAGDLTVGGTLNSDDITSTNISISGNATITGNLTVQGTTTTVNSTAVAISDVNITLAKDATNAAQADGAGFTVAGAGASLLYVSGTDDWTFNKNVNIPNLTVNGQITGNASSATKWATARDLSLTGDATATLAGVDGTANISAAITFATVNANVGTFGNSTTVPTFTVNAKGLITAASHTAIPTATTSINGLASFDNTNFTVTSGLVAISVIDGGTY